MEDVKIQNWLSRLLGLITISEFRAEKSTIPKMAAANALDRRKTARVQYPEDLSIENFPLIFFEGKPIKIQDISLGGTCLIDEFDYLQSTAGNVVNLELVWPDFVKVQPSVIIAAGYTKRHLRFLNLDPSCFVRLNVLLKPGYLGLRMRKIYTPTSRLINSGVSEMWAGLTGESISIFPYINDYLPIAEISLFGVNVDIFPESVPVYRAGSSEFMPGQRISLEFLQNLLIFLLNIQSPSEAISKLVEILSKVHRKYVDPME